MPESQTGCKVLLKEESDESHFKSISNAEKHVKAQYSQRKVASYKSPYSNDIKAEEGQSEAV